jgi:hypothetical protein
MTALASTACTDETPGIPGVFFGRSADGMTVALVGETAFAMAPARDGRHYLVTGWRIRRPMSEWTRGDFYGHSGELADASSFRNAVLEQAEHQREKQALSRREARIAASTPWGASQGATVYADGVVFHDTAGHGGIHLSAERNGQIHPMLRADGGWYEEDECWAIVAIHFPHLFTSFERRCAERTVKDSWPDAWEKIFGTILGPGESRERDRLAFERKHAGDWIVIAATTSDLEKGFVECVATRGGKRGHVDERRFLVPSTEYRVGQFGFVIDEARHRAWDGPSDFAGRRGRAA